MATIIGVRFREAGRVYYFNPGKHLVAKGDRVIVETARGVECGEVTQDPTDLPDEEIKHPLKEMIRVATAEDIRRVESKAAREADAFRVCEGKILTHGLDMKLVNVECNFDGSKIIFHFTADQRVDFRALVRDLAGVFHTRIELRQIGVRDEAKLLGGLGICGRPFCCSQFMGDFHPVSIKMAKEQGLSLNPAKISGTCGRLMCCLKYEEAAYEDALKHLPRPGSYIDTPEGRGMVTEVNAISANIKVRLEQRPDAPPITFHYDQQEGAQRPAPPARRLIPPTGQAAMPELPLELPQAQQKPSQEKGRQEQRQPKRRPADAKGKKPDAKGAQPLSGEPGAADRRTVGVERRAAGPVAKNKQQPSGERGTADHRTAGATAGKSMQQPGGEPGTADRRTAGATAGKNWRERHAQGKAQQPAYRQPQQRMPAPPPVQSDARSAPRYSEIQAPRRAAQEITPKVQDAAQGTGPKSAPRRQQKRGGKAGNNM